MFFSNEMYLPTECFSDFWRKVMLPRVNVALMLIAQNDDREWG